MTAGPRDTAWYRHSVGPHRSRWFRNSVSAHWPFRSDPRRIVQENYDIREYNDPKNDPMIPHTLLLKPGLRARSGSRARRARRS